MGTTAAIFRSPDSNQCSSETLWSITGTAIFVIIVAMVIAIYLNRRRRFRTPLTFITAAYSDNVPGRESSNTFLSSVVVTETSAPAKDSESKPNGKPTVAATSLDNARACSEGEKAVTRVTGAGPHGHVDTFLTRPVSSEDSVAADVHRTEKKTDRCSLARRSLLPLDSVQLHLIERLEFGILEDDFKKIPIFTEDSPRDVSCSPENSKKNRFHSILPYDKNRVVLNDGHADNSASDYINASYIDGYQKEKAYIATQGPKENTAADFWRMIWQEKITHVVMLTNLRERGKEKCIQYWPEDEGEGSEQTYGAVTVKTVCVERRDTFYTRLWAVSKEGTDEVRGVTQLHYVSWPDFGVPTTASLVTFWRHVVRKTSSEEISETGRPPLLVHCSAGVGRTGTLIALDIAMQQVVAEHQLNLVELVTSLRDQRCLMVQAEAQFTCLHVAILEAYSSRQSTIQVDDMINIFPKPVDALQTHSTIDKEFTMLMEMKSLAPEIKCRKAKERENRDKNRDSDIWIADDHLPFLIDDVPGRGNYISAVYMPTFRDPRGSLMTQLPLPTTLVDFWRLVLGDKVAVIVSLCSPSEQTDTQSYCQYWPRSEGEVIEANPYTVTFQALSHESHHLKSYRVTVTKTGDSWPRQVEVLHYEGWTGQTGGNPEHLMHVIDTLVSSMSELSSHRYIVQCTDGVQKSGLFCTLCGVIDRMTYDREVDIYTTVRRVQSISLKAVTSVEQYRYLYEAARQRCVDMSLYVNHL